MRLWMMVAAFSVGACAAASAFAQGYPTKPVRVIVPFAERGGTDLIARIVSQKLSDAQCYWADLERELRSAYGDR